MKAVLLDTGVLLRERHVTDAKHALAVRAIEGLVKAGWSVRVAPQCLQEYWAVATRRAQARGGLGLTPKRAAMDIERILSVHNLLTETPDLFDEWRDIVSRYRVSGRQVWDARLAAIMRLHGVRHLLTFNPQDFHRFDFLRAWLPESVDRFNSRGTRLTWELIRTGWSRRLQCQTGFESFNTASSSFSAP